MVSILPNLPQESVMITFEVPLNQILEEGNNTNVNLASLGKGKIGRRKLK